MIGQMCGVISCTQGRYGETGDTATTRGGRTKGGLIFYKVLVQAIPLYELDTWFLLAEMERKVEGIHTKFMQLITGKQEKQLRDGTWETPRAEGGREAAGTKLERNYIKRRQATVPQWVMLCSLFRVRARETGCEGVGYRR